MRYARGGTRLVIAALTALVATSACAVENDPLPVPVGSPREAAVRAYNDGVQRLLERKFAEAQRQFEQALRLEDSLAEAHNNLAFSLRMQGAHNFERSLQHYDRAIELKPGLAQAYMYRGLLFTQIGRFRARTADLERLLSLDRELAAKLEKVIAGDSGRDDGGAGISAQYEYSCRALPTRVAYIANYCRSRAGGSSAFVDGTPLGPSGVYPGAGEDGDDRFPVSTVTYRATPSKSVCVPQ